jgi:hypothetical protein
MSSAELPEHGAEHDAALATVAYTISERRRKVATMLAARVTQREMAKALGVSNGTIASDCKAIEAEWTAEATQAYSQHIIGEHARLNVLEAAFWADAMKGDVKAGNMVVRISESRRKLLGLDAPTRTEVAFGTITDLDQRRAAIMELIDAVLPNDDSVIDV